MLTRAHFASRWIRGEVQKNKHAHAHTHTHAHASHTHTVFANSSELTQPEERGLEMDDPHREHISFLRTMTMLHMLHTCHMSHKHIWQAISYEMQTETTRAPATLCLTMTGNQEVVTPHATHTHTATCCGPTRVQDRRGHLRFKSSPTHSLTQLTTSTVDAPRM